VECTLRSAPAPLILVDRQGRYAIIDLGILVVRRCNSVETMWPVYLPYLRQHASLVLDIACLAWHWLRACKKNSPDDKRTCSRNSTKGP
jgi:hypothetical protein